ncbi:hypothetical protein TMatcc_007524 [Talaromyces marneffei ATCC 18224]
MNNIAYCEDAEGRMATLSTKQATININNTAGAVPRIRPVLACREGTILVMIINLRATHKRTSPMIDMDSMLRKQQLG